MDIETTLHRILDGMADFENRISFMENSMPCTREPSESRETVLLTRIGRHEFEQLKSQVNFLNNKITEMRAKKKEADYL